MKLNLLFLKKFYGFGINLSPSPIELTRSMYTGSGKAHTPATSFQQVTENCYAIGKIGVTEQRTNRQTLPLTEWNI